MITALFFLSDTDDSEDNSSDDIPNDHWTNGSSTTDGWESRNRESIPYDLDNAWFLKYLHIPRDVFETLYEGILEKLTSTEREPTVYEKLLATLRYLAKGTCTSDLGVGGYKAMPRKAFQQMFLQTLAAVHGLVFSKYISLVPHASDGTQQEADRSFVEQFPKLAGVGLCAIGTRIEIAEPAEDKYLFYYKYGAYCLNALMICDQSKRIRYANANFCAAMNDVYLWSSSGLDGHFSDEYYNGSASCYVLASSTFPSKAWLITPKQDAKPNSSEATFNEQHDRAFSAAEETIRLLKDRFRCLLGNPPIPYKPSECTTIVHVCCALHNMCMECENVK